MDSDDNFVTQSTIINPVDDESDDDFNYRFGDPLCEAEIYAKIARRIPQATRYKYDWAITVFARWQEERRNRPFKCNLQIPANCLQQEITEMGAENLNIALKYFVFEARKQDRTFYPSHTLHALYATLQGYLRAKNIRMDLLGGDEFIEAKAALDADMKERSAIGLGASSRKSTEVITDEEENMLWEKRILGDNTPQQLLDTILYLTGLHFSLRGGIEHRNLRLFRNPQITGPTEDANGRSYLLYKEDTSKTNSGGLRERKNKPKEVRAYDNPTDPSRCYVRLFQKYRNACEAIAGKTNAFYFQPLKKAKKQQWFSSVPVGHNMLQGTVKRMCQMGGIPGRKTNHSLRATSATRLYQKNVEEQLICEQTGKCVDMNCRKPLNENTSKENIRSILTPVRSVGMKRLREAIDAFSLKPTGKKYTIVTGSSSNHFHECRNSIRKLHKNVFPHLSNFSFYFYDLGLTENQRMMVRDLSGAEIRDFPFSKFSPSTGYLKCYLWKPLILLAHLQNAEFLVWLDSSVQYHKPMNSYFETVATTGFLSVANGHQMAQHTSSKFFSYFGDEACQFSVYDELEGGHLVLHNEPFTQRVLLEPLASCALDPNCMCPPESRNMLNCPRNIHTYSMCHRYDQSAISFLLAKVFREKVASFHIQNQIHNVIKSNSSIEPWIIVMGVCLIMLCVITMSYVICCHLYGKSTVKEKLSEISSKG